MVSELRVDKIHNEGGDNDSGIDLSTNDQIVLKTANTTRLTMNATGQTEIVGEGGSVMTNLQNGLCKAWVNADNDASRNDSFNFDGETDHGTGDYSYDLIAHMSATNSYSQSGIARTSVDGRIITRNTTRDTAGVVAVECSDDGGTLTDIHHDIFIVGDLA
tara:strand:+ start:584 stop:1066 length:483 start_codon:yes stop_codon:yes gene_type:complete